MTSGITRTGLGVLLTLAAFLPAGGAERGSDPAPAMAPPQVLAQSIENPQASGTLEDALSACERQASRFGRFLVIVDWAELGAAGVTRDTRVTLEGRTATVQQYLDQALQSACPQAGRLGWYRVETTVFVTTKDYILRNLARISSAAVSAGGGRSGSAEGSAPAAAPAPAPAPAPRRASSGVTFDEAPLETVLDYVREISEVSLHVNWRALEAAGVTRTTPVTIEVKHLSGSRLLDLTVDQLTTGDDKLRKVYWYIEDGIVFLSTGQALNDTPVTSRIYQIGPMLAEAPNFVGPRIDISKLGQNSQSSSSNSGLFGGGDKGAGGAGGDSSGDSGNTPSREERRKALQDQIIAMIKGTTTADMWEPDGKGRVTILRDRVIVSQTKLGWILMGK